MGNTFQPRFVKFAFEGESDLNSGQAESISDQRSGVLCCVRPEVEGAVSGSELRTVFDGSRDELFG